MIDKRKWPVPRGLKDIKNLPSPAEIRQILLRAKAEQARRESRDRIKEAWAATKAMLAEGEGTDGRLTAEALRSLMRSKGCPEDIAVAAFCTALERYTRMDTGDASDVVKIRFCPLLDSDLYELLYGTSLDSRHGRLELPLGISAEERLATIGCWIAAGVWRSAEPYPASRLSRITEVAGMLLDRGLVRPTMNM